MNPFEWIAPGTLAEASRAATATMADAMCDSADGASILKAGGVDVLDLMKEDLVAPRRVVDLHRIPGMDRIAEERDGGLRLGALVTLADLAEHPLLDKYASLRQAAGSAGSPQLRNRATIGGTLLQRPHCWYFRSPHFPCRRKGGQHCFALTGENQYHAIFANDICAMVHPSGLATALVALDASVDLVNRAGETRRVRLEDFFIASERDVTRENDLKAGEILTAILLPSLAPSARCDYVKLGEKAAFDWPLAEIAVTLELDPNGLCQAARLVLGAVAPIPYRVAAAEQQLIGQRITAKVALQAAQAAMASATPLAGNAYKVPIFAALLQRTIMRTAGTP